MRRNRITAAILALPLAVAVTLVPARQAVAHPGATAFTIGVGVSTPLYVLVPADYGKDINRVDIADAPGFDLQGASAPAGWATSRTGDVITFTGGTITPGPGILFTIRGVARAPGMLLFPVTTHSPDGTSKLYNGGPTSSDAGVVVYAGTAPSSVPGKPFPWKAVGGGALVGVGVVGTVALVWRRRRARPVGP